MPGDLKNTGLMTSLYRLLTQALYSLD